MKTNFTLSSKPALALAGAWLLSLPSWAQEAATAAAPEAAPESMFGIPGLSTAGLLVLCLTGLLLTAVLVLGGMVFVQSLPLLEKLYARPGLEHSFMARLIALLRGDAQLLTGKATDVVLDDHDYDGIHEFDNDLPPWWKYSFYATIVFSVVYLLNYHVWGGKLQDAEYQHEMQQAALLQPKDGSGNAQEVTNFKPLTDAALLEAGHATYTQNCAACHGQNGEGMVGPNLTDEFWLHGGDVNDVFKVIKYGVTSKGMVAWQSKLSDDQILEVSSYLLSLQGTKPANGKAPQGEKYEGKK
ncbi:cbb3-type cytochrome c oxidase N-terminal domain-containing protein [Rufibacter sp. LB8]|uniref:cbb3-type cytochrome c oxidase N-terminal domain-containing protein n=1 Tax=Rufibacter sp. LB8 TaxID=2777781 RepID=UPI00178C519F|nr:cbb3-type cytochrome c oxidase N-terminal domain-containing protein [Rufibacter sp. LB8]